MGSKIGRTPSWEDGASARQSPSALPYLPALLVSLLLAGFVVVAGSHWGESAAYLAFARMAGAPPPSPSTVIISAGSADGNADAGRLARLTAAVFAQGPAAVAMGPLPADLRQAGYGAPES